MIIAPKRFLRLLISLLMIVFVLLSVTGCSSVIKGINQVDKARKAIKGSAAVVDVVDVKRNVDVLCDKVLSRNKR